MDRLDPAGEEGVGVFGYLDSQFERAYRLRLASNPALDQALAGRSDAYRTLDAAILEELVLKGILGMSAEDIAANCAPSSLAVIKQQVYADTMRDVFDASDDAEKLMHESMQRPDFIEGITSFFEKRQPNFPPAQGPARGSLKGQEP